MITVLSGIQCLEVTGNSSEECQDELEKYIDSHKNHISNILGKSVSWYTKPKLVCHLRFFYT